jgi:hypothetical protein
VTRTEASNLDSRWQDNPLHEPGRRKNDVMANKAGPTRQKRDRERARQQKQKEKALRRLAVKQQKALTGPRKQGEEDPDIAGIRPGPQPLPPQWDLQE